MVSYWWIEPRGFANEIDVRRAATAEQAEFLEEEGYRQISRAELREHVAWVNAENDAWGSSRAVGRYSFKAMVDPDDEDHTYHAVWSKLVDGELVHVLSW